MKDIERYQRIKAEWASWSESPTSDGPWIPTPGDLNWLFQAFIPSMAKCIAENRDFKSLWEHAYMDREQDGH